MTPEKALEIHHTYTAGKCGSVKKSEYIEAIRVAFAMLEKQIAKKPSDDRYPWSICPVCGGSINCEEVQEYIHNKECSHCVHCGQKIDWSDTE